MERPEIVELFYSALINPKDVEQCLGFLGPSVEWILPAADPQTTGEELSSNAIKFSGTEEFRQLALYFRDRLHVISGDLAGCITRLDLVFCVRESPIAIPRNGTGGGNKSCCQNYFSGLKNY